ncbi:hypothetical protein [Streptomyces sp. NPDC101455]|uniref:hypothetical protein n=1 Tax=Streptomyces sp. NPDC101455 TaxID=3366142 RepID=UPI0037F4DF67
MSLDMTGLVSIGVDPHFRRYLNPQGQITVIQVQYFDYHHYDAARFVDFNGFSTRLEAENTVISPNDVLSAVADEPEGSPAHGQAARLLLAINAHHGLVGGTF